MKTVLQIGAWAHAEAVRLTHTPAGDECPGFTPSIVAAVEQAILHGYSQGASDMAAALRGVG